MIVIVDTSVLCELLLVPSKSKKETHERDVERFKRLEQRSLRVDFLVPLTVFIETGNHIGQAQGDRRAAAQRFVEFTTTALDGQSPFSPTQLPNPHEVREWLEGFVDDATAGIGLGDRSLIAEWEKQRRLHPSRRVQFWSHDQHLEGYDTGES